MTPIFTATLVLALVASVAGSVAASAESTAEPRSVLWVGAHPDDEILAAPLLAHWCGEAGARCTLLVLTRGEAGRCLLADGCVPSLEVVRGRELAKSARWFSAKVVTWDLPDGGGLAGRWGEVSGGNAALVARLAAAMVAIRPDIVLSFDPRHGTTCHGDHRTTGRLVVSAAVCTERLLGARPQEVFAAFARPDHLARWWGPRGFTNTFERFEFVPDGRWVFVMHAPNGADYPNESVFREIVADARIVLEHVVQPWYRLTVTLTQRADGTLLEWEQEFASQEIAAKMRPLAGPANEQNLDRLQALFAGGAE